MRLLAIVVVVFAILAFDLASNNGRLLGCVEGFRKSGSARSGFLNDAIPPQAGRA